MPRPPRGRISKTVLVLGELLITFGLVVLLFIFYELKITDWKTADSQRHLSKQLATQWEQPVPAATASPDPTAPKAKPVVDPPLKVTDGEGFSILRIPRFGTGYHWVVVEGVSRDDLEKGPGHYPGTALPGQLGNVVISAHRTTYGHAFNRLDELRNGDTVSLQVRSRTYTYRVIRTQIVDPSATSVIFPVPGDLNAVPTKRLLTMTTCNPEYSAAQRLIVTAELTTAATGGTS
jgi:sortase A